MIVYCNLKTVTIKDKKYKVIPVLRLSSVKLKGRISSSHENEKIEGFIKSNKLPKTKEKFLKCLIEEARKNKFEFIIEKA